MHKDFGYGIVLVEILFITLVKEEWGNPLFRVFLLIIYIVLKERQINRGIMLVKEVKYESSG